MSYKGIVKNGIIQLEPSVRLPEGMTVRVELVADAPAAPTPISDEDPLLKMLALAGPTGISDLSVNADHYL